MINVEWLMLNVECLINCVNFNLRILPTELLESYCKEVNLNLQEQFDALKDAELSTPNFSFYTSVSSVFSSKIEGESIELDSYVKHKRFGVEFQPDYTKKIDDLYNAYIFAQNHKLNQEQILKAHSILSEHIIAEQWQGRHRQQNMYVTTAEGRIEYVAASPFEVETEMEKLYADLEILSKTRLTIKEAFFLRCNDSFGICKNSSIQRRKRSNSKAFRKMVFGATIGR